MKDELKEVLISMGLYGSGVYTRFIFGGKIYNTKQKIALIIFGLGILIVINYLNLPQMYSTAISLVAGIWTPNIVAILIKTGDKSEEPASDKLSKKIDKIL
jgi:hypothetical protein